ncbi:MAG: cytochrome C [Desulfobacteraceae bacterium]|nr:MAG: cytochrome C [Desulfobacteraceae bacterium]
MILGILVSVTAGPAVSRHALYAKSTVADTFIMETDAYKKHTKGLVEFGHQQHVDAYQISCGQCHHDDQGRPLDLKPGDDVQKCIECHKETKKVKGEKLSKKERINKYHKEALHANCINCHKAFNKKNGDPKGKSPAPVSCSTCHPKK